MALSYLICDFETSSACDLKKAGAHVYAEDPTTAIICFNYRFRGEKKVHRWCPDINVGDELRLRQAAMDGQITFVAHHADFEKAIWRAIMVKDFGFFDIPDERWHDTMAVCAVKSIPLALDKVLRVLGLDEQKDVEGGKAVKAFSKPDKKGYIAVTETERETALLYCDQDIRAEHGLHEHIGWLPIGERRFWLLNQKMNQRGIGLDLEFIDAAQKIVDLASLPLVQEHRDLTGLNPTQGAKLLKWFEAQGVKVPNLQKETVIELLGEDIDATDDGGTVRDAGAEDEGDGGDEDDPFDASDDTEDGEESGPRTPLPDNVRRVLGIRQLVGSASVKKLKRMRQCVCADGRSRGLIQFHGTSPGRGAGRLFQPLNFPRGTVKKIDGKKYTPQELVDLVMSGDPEFVEMMTGYGAIEVIVSSLRHALKAAPGHTFISGDYAGIQARTVLALAGQHDKCAIMAAGEDIYLTMAMLIYKRLLTKADVEERQTGKNSVLGLGFQMGAKKFRLKYAKTLPVSFAENVVRTYREEFAPKVPKLWYGLEHAAVQTVHTHEVHEAYGIEYRLTNSWLTARLPSGRLLWYRNPQPTRRAMPWDATDIRPSFTYQTQKNGQWVTIDAYGGILTENVVMGIEVDIQRQGIKTCEENGYPVVLEVYDEVLAEPRTEDVDEKAFEQMLLNQEPWVKAMGIPIATETWVGDRYRK